MQFVPIFKLPSEYIKWIPMNERSAGDDLWEFKTLDPHDSRVREGTWPPLGTYSEPGAPPVTSNINVLALLLDDDGDPKSTFVVLSFSRTSYKAGKNMATYLKRHQMQGLPPWGRTYWLFSHQESRDIGGKNVKYYTMRVAQGEKTAGVNPLVDQFCGDIATQLSSPDNGRELQEAWINRAAFADDDAASGDAQDDDATADSAQAGNATGGGDSDENPF